MSIGWILASLLGLAGTGGIDMQPLTGAALRAALVGTLVTQDAAASGIRTTERGERFEADGRYVRLADRASIEGVYVLGRDRVCITLRTAPALEDCRQVLRDDRGRLFFARVAPAPDRRPWPITARPAE